MHLSSEVNQPIMTNGFRFSRLLLFPADQSIFQVLLNFSSMYNGWYHLYSGIVNQCNDFLKSGMNLGVYAHSSTGTTYTW